MSNRGSRKNPKNNLVNLRLKVQQADPLVKELVTQQAKEITKLQKALVKSEVKNHTDNARAKAQLAAERKNKLKIVISKKDSEA